MLFYPHNQFVAGTVIARAVSASNAITSSYINNTSVAGTAFLALNISGANGTNGSNASAISGIQGDQGDQGTRGPRGLNIWLLSSSWTTASCWATSGPGSTCYPIPMFKRIGDPNNPCSTISAPTIYTTAPAVGDVTLLVSNYSPVYSDSICTQPILDDPIIGVNGNIIYSASAAGTASFSGSCIGNVS